MEGVCIEGAVIAFRGAKWDVDVDGRCDFILQILIRFGLLSLYLRKKRLR